MRPAPTLIRAMRFVIIASAWTIGLLVSAWLLAGLGPRPLLVNKSGFSRAIYDHNGRLLRLTLSNDEKYRLWTPLSQIPPTMIAATLLQEDAWFRWHAGVNPISLMRALVATYIQRSRRIGGSTITMQLARQRFGINSCTPWGKLEQMLRALELDRDYTKDQLLEAYLNSVPYGGNIEGVGAASIIYFGKPAKDLSLAEALTLAVIPQHPEKRSPLPGSHPGELGEARLRLAHEWRSHHGNSASDLIETLDVSAASRHELPFLAPHLVDRLLASGDSDARIMTTVDSELQELVERRLKSYVERNQSLASDNGAVMLLDYRTMQVSAYVGSANYFNAAIDGQVDGLRGRRSPGSALKPFIYALAIDQGLIHP
jgi:penicillin-binding protein 1C